MTVTATLKASGEFGLTTTTGGTTVSTTLGAITFAADSLVVVVLGSIKNETADSLLSASATGLTFTAQARAFQTVFGAKADAAILTAPDASGGSRTISITSDTNRCYGLFYAIYEVTGHDTTTPIGATAEQADDLTDGAKTMTLSAAPASDSLVIGAVQVDTDPGASTIDPGATFTESVEIDSSASFYGAFEVETRTGSTSTTVDWADVRASSSVVAYSTAGVAVEIIAGASTPNTGDATGAHAWSGAATGTNQPATPANLQATAVSDTQIDLTWDAVSAASGYDIERDGVVIVTDHATTSYSDTGLTAATAYDYRVRAVV